MDNPLLVNEIKGEQELSSHYLRLVFCESLQSHDLFKQ